MSAIAHAAPVRRRPPISLSSVPAGWPRTAAVMGILLLVYSSWQFSGWPSSSRSLVGDLWFGAFALAETIAATLAARRCPAGSRLRSGWRLLALGAGSYLAGDLVWTGYEVAGSIPYPSIADGFSLMFYPLTLAGLLRFPSALREIGRRVQLGLDLAVVATGGVAFVGYVVLAPMLTQSGPDPLQTAFSVAYPVGDLVLLVGLGAVVLRGSGASSERALWFIGAALLAFVTADLLYGYATLNGTFAGGDPIDAGYMVAMALFTVGAAAQLRPGEPSQVVRRALGRASWLPFVAVAGAFGLLLYDQRHAGLPSFTLVMAAVALAALVSVRQFIAERDLRGTQDRLSHQSLHDALTGLPNRSLVIDRAERMLARARRSETTAAALYVDIDGFKQINDTFGHAAGDELLHVVATRLAEVVREADTVGRLGDDEFVLLLEDTTLDAGPELVAERACEVLAQPIALTHAGGRKLAITASVGIALGQQCTADELLRDADLALYEAKGAGKNRAVLFESSMQTAAQDRLTLEMDLKDALEEDQLFLLYQPTFDLESETITGIEALIRWRHPTRGVVPPLSFIPLAEATGLIVQVGRWVLRTACQQAVAWREEGIKLGLSVNVSGRQLDETDFVADVARIVGDAGIDPGTLTLEITETALMRDSDAAARQLRQLKRLGLRIAIDDFGTGYSSLAYLRKFPVDALKIDRSFIAGIASSGDSKVLIHTLVQLGKTLGLETVGEGIEQRAQLRHLQREQCDSGQGFLFARPLEPEAIPALLQSGNEPAAVHLPPVPVSR
jgi:diguanylate cyclase (GGDEF)-like protein